MEGSSAISCCQCCAVHLCVRAQKRVDRPRWHAPPGRRESTAPSTSGRTAPTRASSRSQRHQRALAGASSHPRRRNHAAERPGGVRAAHTRPRRPGGRTGQCPRRRRRRCGCRSAFAAPRRACEGARRRARPSRTSAMDRKATHAHASRAALERPVRVVALAALRSALRSLSVRRAHAPTAARAWQRRARRRWRRPKERRHEATHRAQVTARRAGPRGPRLRWGEGGVGAVRGWVWRGRRLSALSSRRRALVSRTRVRRRTLFANAVFGIKTRRRQSAAGR